MIERQRRWYEQEKWAVRRTIESVRALPESARADERYQRALDKIAHVLVARQIWYERLAGVEPRGDGSAEGMPIDRIEALNAEVEREWDDYLGTLDDARLRNAVDYGAPGGPTRSSTIGDILLHVYTHGFYHRGQVAALVNSLGGEPAQTGFIMWTREGR